MCKQRKSNLHKAGNGTLALSEPVVVLPALTITRQLALKLQPGYTLPEFLKGQGTIHLQNYTLTIPQDNLLNEFSGRIIGPGSVVKTGKLTTLEDGQILAMIDGDLKQMDENASRLRI